MRVWWCIRQWSSKSRSLLPSRTAPFTCLLSRDDRDRRQIEPIILPGTQQSFFFSLTYIRPEIIFPRQSVNYPGDLTATCTTNPVGILMRQNNSIAPIIVCTYHALINPINHRYLDPEYRQKRASWTINLPQVNRDAAFVWAFDAASLSTCPVLTLTACYRKINCSKIGCYYFDFCFFGQYVIDLMLVLTITGRHRVSKALIISTSSDIRCGWEREWLRCKDIDFH